MESSSHRSYTGDMLAYIGRFIARQVQREIHAGSDVLWDSVRSVAYAPFLVSTLLLVGGYLDAEHWTWITAATVAADGMRRSVSTAVTSISKALQGDDDDDGNSDTPDTT
jgi:hypothetical protein